MKKIAKIAGIMIIISVFLLIIGFMTNASKHIYFDSSGVHVAEREKRVLISEPLPQDILNININVVSADIRFVNTADEFKIELYNYKEQYEWSVDGNTLRISEDLKYNKKFIIDLDFFGDKRMYGEIKLYIPSGSQFENITMRNVSGDFVLRNFTSKELRAENISGDIKVFNIVSEKMDFSLISGDFDSEDIESEDCSIGLISGDIEIERARLGNLTVKNTSGDIKLSGDVENSKFDVISGDIELNLTGNQNEYKRNIHLLSGSLYINDKKADEKNYSGNETSKGIAVNSKSGIVKLNFNLQ